jgi:hypothetical protein
MEGEGARGKDEGNLWKTEKWMGSTIGSQSEKEKEKEK